MLERHRYNALQIGVVEWFVDRGHCAKLKEPRGRIGGRYSNFIVVTTGFLTCG
jgi:hypothetical protein